MSEPQIKWDDTPDTSSLQPQKQPQKPLPAIPAVLAPAASDHANAPSNSVPNTATSTVNSQIKWDETPDVSALQQPSGAGGSWDTAEKPGFMSTLGSDVYQAGKGLVGAAIDEAKYFHSPEWEEAQ